MPHTLKIVGEPTAMEAAVHAAIGTILTIAMGGTHVLHTHINDVSIRSSCEPHP